MSQPKSTLPIWVNIVLALLIVDIGFRILGWLQVYVYPEYGILTDYLWAWITADVLIGMLALAAFVAISRRSPLGLNLGVVIMAIWIIEIVVQASLAEYDGLELLALTIGFDIAISTLLLVLMERLLRARSVREAFGTLYEDGSPHLEQPPPPPTFDP